MSKENCHIFHFWEGHESSLARQDGAAGGSSWHRHVRNGKPSHPLSDPCILLCVLSYCFYVTYLFMLHLLVLLFMVLIVPKFGSA